MQTLPGEISPAKSFHSIPTTTVTITAGITYFFQITTKDLYENLIRTMRNNTEVTIMALYKDHNDWRSERTGVPDLQDWQEIYGEDIAGLAVFNNRSAAVPDSSYTGQFTIYRAG